MQQLTKLKSTQVATLRATLVIAQGGRCALCQGQFGTRPPLDPVLDHDHKTGAVRGVLHRGCNSLLGKVENNAARYGVRNISAWANGIAAYMLRHMVNTTGYIHPSHKTPDEKRDLRNLRARRARANSKES